MRREGSSRVVPLGCALFRWKVGCWRADGSLPSTCLGLQHRWGADGDTRMKPWLKPGWGARDLRSQVPLSTGKGAGLGGWDPALPPSQARPYPRSLLTRRAA